MLIELPPFGRHSVLLLQILLGFDNPLQCQLEEMTFARAAAVKNIRSVVSKNRCQRATSCFGDVFMLLEAASWTRC
jgi:hypothetical protein